MGLQLPAVCLHPNLTGFYRQRLWGLLFPPVACGAGGSGVRRGPLPLQRELLQPSYFSQFLTTTQNWACGTYDFHIFAPSTHFYVPFCMLIFETSVQPDFRWFLNDGAVV